MMPKKEKILKVQLTAQVNSFRLNDVSHKPGDVFDCPERLFRSDFMKKVEEVAKVEKVAKVPIEVEAEEAPTEEVIIEEIPEVPTEVPIEAPVEDENTEEKKRKRRR